MDPLVSLGWLSEHRNDPSLVVLDATLPPVGVVPVVDTAARYRERHIPGALFFDIEAFSDHATGLPHMMPSPEDFAGRLGGLGVDDEMTIVVYEQKGVFSAPRAWWMLRSIGARNVRVLDGDLDAWIAAGHPVDAGTAVRPAATFHARFQPDAICNFEQVQAALEEGTTAILDARSAGRFSGSLAEPRAGIRSGHMPGSINLPFPELIENGRFKSAPALRTLFQEHGIDFTQPIITSCGSGVTAAVLALGLERCAAEKVSLYDGSWAEYAQRPGVAIVHHGGQHTSVSM